MSSSRGSATVYGDESDDIVAPLKPSGSASPSRDKGKGPVAQEIPLARTAEYIKRPFFVPISEANGGLLGALSELDDQLRAGGRARLLSRKSPSTWIGRTIAAGECGLYSHGGLPKIITKPGRYPGFPLGNWFARSWAGTAHLSETVIEHAGLMMVQISQNQAAVISDPSNTVFVVRNGGFVSLSLSGSFRVLGVVDQVNLTQLVVDPLSGGEDKRVLGHFQEVRMSNTGTLSNSSVVATFLDIPANNCVILQKGDHLEKLPAGQHVITTPGVTVRGWFTTGESQLELPSRDMYTKDQVPVELRVYLRWVLEDPLKLCRHGYSTPFQAMKDKTLSVLTQIVSHLEYSSMVKQRSFKPGDTVSDGPDTSNAAFLDSLRTSAMDELHEVSLEYGIVLKDLAVIDRKFKGEIAKQMDSLVMRALQAQVEATNVDRENSNRVKLEEGKLSVASVKAKQRKTEADADSYATVAQAKANAESVKIEAHAAAEAVRISAQAEAEAITLRAVADTSIKDSHARGTQLARVEVQRVKAYGNRTMFVPTEGGFAANIGSNVAGGFGYSLGANQSQTPAA